MSTLALARSATIFGHARTGLLAAFTGKNRQKPAGST
jgi:hypothetical protein